MTDKAAQCRNCHWWRDPATGDRLGRASDDGEVGECRRHAPQVVAFPDQRTNRWATRTSWPSTMANHGCGDFSPGGPAGAAPAEGPAEGPDGMIHKAMSRRMGEGASTPSAAPKSAPAPRPKADKELDHDSRLAAAAAAKAVERSAPAPRRGPTLPTGDLDVSPPPSPERRRGPSLPTGDLNVPAPPEPPRPKPAPQTRPPQKPRPPLEDDAEDAVSAMLGEDIAPDPAPPAGGGADMLKRVASDMGSSLWKDAVSRLPQGGGHDIAGLEGWRQTLSAFRAGPPQPITHVPKGQRDAADDVGYFAYGKLKAPIIVAPDSVVRNEAEARDWLHAALVHAAQEKGRTLPVAVRRDYGLE